MIDIVHLRARQRVTLDSLAGLLGITANDLRTLELTPIGLWEIVTVAHYSRALGYRTRLFVERDGVSEEVQL